MSDAAKFVRIVDLESTGLDPASADIIEVGWCDVYADGRIGGPGSMFVRSDRPVDIEARATHHITDKEIADGCTKECAIGMLTGGSPVAYAAHSAKFEQSFWPDAPAPWICTYKAALRLFPDAPRHTNQVLRYFLKIDDNPDFEPNLAMPPHRAGPDAYVTAFVLSHMLMLEGDRRLSRLLAWNKEPALLPRVKFGKHFGAKWSDVPGDYLQWVMRQRDMDPDIVFTAHTELLRRRAG
jgi:exodeoxyribonuclease X